LFSRFGLEATKVKPSSKTYLLTPSTGIRLFSRPATSLFFSTMGIARISLLESNEITEVQQGL
jgi:hypothetical protein